MATNRFRCRHTGHVDVEHLIVRDAVESGVANPLRRVGGVTCRCADESVGRQHL